MKTHLKSAERAELVSRELRAMRKTAFLVSKVLYRLLREEKVNAFGLQRKLSRSTTEKLRLTILQVWSTRYKVPLTYIIRTLLDYWRKKTRRPGRRTILGVSIRTLTSKGSEGILQGAILRDFPGAENESQWQTAERLRLLGLDQPRGRGKSLLEVSWMDNCKMYGKRVYKRRRKLDKAVTGQWRRRRRWRGNPWL